GYDRSCALRGHGDSASWSRRKNPAPPGARAQRDDANAALHGNYQRPAFGSAKPRHWKRTFAPNRSLQGRALQGSGGIAYRMSFQFEEGWKKAIRGQSPSVGTMLREWSPT